MAANAFAVGKDAFQAKPKQKKQSSTTKQDGLKQKQNLGGKMRFWKRKQPERVIEYRMPTEVEQMQLERRQRTLARLERLRKTHDAKVWIEIHALEASIAPQLQQLQALRRQLKSIPYEFGQMALIQQAAQAQSPFTAFHGLLNPLAGLGISAR